MFNNANVIFRTKFVDGVSTVSFAPGSAARLPAVRWTAPARNVVPRCRRKCVNRVPLQPVALLFFDAHMCVGVGRVCGCVHKAAVSD